jgi:hypothetical protein
MEGPAQQKEKVLQPENFAPGGPKWGIENAMFFNILAPMARLGTYFTNKLYNY